MQRGLALEIWQPPSRARWTGIVILSVLLHVLPLSLLTLPRDLRIPEPEMTQTVLNLLPADAAAAQDPADPAELERAAEAMRPAQALSPAVPEPAPLEARTEEKEIPKVPPEKPKEAAPAERLHSAVAFDASRGDEKPPLKPDFLGPNNSVAADHGPKALPLGAPYMEGESKEVAFAARRGETDRQAPRADPQSGSVAHEGAERVGTPPEPREGQAVQEQGAGAASTARENVLPPKAEPALAVSKVAKEIEAPLDIKRGNVKPDLLPPTGDEKWSIVPPAGQPDTRQDSAVKPETSTENDAQRRTEAEKPAHSERPKDPELARLERLLAGAAQEHALPNPGATTREGQAGHEGDGRVREGERAGVSDVLTANLDSRAANAGEVSFSKVKDEEAAYLQGFFRRMDAKWKANVYSRTRTRLDLGTVTMRIVLGRDGKLLEAAEVRRTQGLGDDAVALCKTGIEQAAPHEPFPASLGAREKLVVEIVFLYR